MIPSYNKYGAEQSSELQLVRERQASKQASGECMCVCLCVWLAGWLAGRLTDCV